MGKFRISRIASSIFCVVALLAFDKPSFAGDTLLQAVTFALTGSDVGNVSLIDHATCTYDVAASSGNGISRYYINNIDIRRSTVQLYHNAFNEWTQVELRGPSIIYEYILDGKPSSPLSQTTMRLETKELERVKRAWLYIYSHGCRYTPSPF